MAGKSKKRSADTSVEDLDEELRSPPNRSRHSEAGDVDENLQQEGMDEEEETQEEEQCKQKEDPSSDEHEHDAEQHSREEKDETAEDLGDEDIQGKEIDDQHDAEKKGNMEVEDDDEGDDDDQSASRVKRKINVEGRPAEAGVIKTVVVENFMCHQKLSVNLCRNVNFIHGANGSGKSAILAAIQICLGANARRTNRARNIKDLVRKEAAGSQRISTARVKVTILNGGGDGFKHEVYGDQITVERVIQLHGGFNGYRLLDEDGKEVCRRKQELDDMLDYLNIQVDNPVAILDQEEAKKFLTGKASDKHAFFMKATELQRIDRVFAAVADRADELASTEARLTDSLAAKAELVKSHKKIVDEFQAVEELEKKRLDFEIDYAWAFFAERNEEYEDAMQKMETFKKKADLKQQELTQAEEEASGANDENEEKRIRERMQELQNEAESQAKLKRDLEAEVKLAQKPVKEAQRELKQLGSDKKSVQQTLDRAKKRLKEAREEQIKQAGNAESEEARRTAQLTETEEALTREKADADKVKEAVAVAYRTYEEQEPEFLQAKEQAAKKVKECQAVKFKLRDLQSSESNDPAAIFGPKCSKMNKLVEEARRKRRFKGEVLGPIGAFLKMAPGKEKYADLAELAIGNGTLDRYIVTNNHDRKEFESMRKQLKCFRECGIYQVTASRRFNIPPPPADDIETVASVLVISNDVVFNCLVDHARIDQRALAPNKAISEERLLISQNGRYEIRGNINEVYFLPKGDKWIVRGGAISLASNDRRARKLIGADRTEAIKDGQAELRQLEGEVSELRKAETAAGKTRADLKLKWNESNRAKRANEDKIKELTRKKDDLENEMESTAKTSIDTTEMEEDVAKGEEKLDDFSQEQEKKKTDLEKLLPEYAAAKKRLDEVDTRNEKVLKDMGDAEKNLEAVLQRLTQSESDLAKKREKVRKYEAVIKEHQAMVDKNTGEKDKALVMAKRLTLRQSKREDGQEETEKGGPGSTQEITEEDLERVEVREVAKSTNAYEAKLKKVKQKIERERERGDLSPEDREAATEKYVKAKRDLQETQKGVNEAQRLYEDTQRDLRARQKRWAKLRRHLETMTDSRFDQILQLNNASGQLEFDDGELHLIHQKDMNDPNSQTKDVKALSGGERSYTTISLLLALGESLETPFRVLDEFDVFLDPQARKLTIQTLIHVAKKMEHRQFIFITPQDLSSVKPDSKVKIFKLNPPKRYERAGGGSQALIDNQFSQQG